MLNITCFATFQATLDGQAITRFRSAKERALLVYLAVEQERAHQRSSLAGLLWPDEPEAKARHNLAQTLVNLRNAIGDRAVNPPYLVISPQTIAFNPVSDHQVDVTAFLRYLRERTPVAQQQAIDLYSGPFLADFSVTDSDLLENWILTQREHLHQEALTAFSNLCDHYENSGEVQQAQQVVRRFLALAPWQEEAHRQLMRLLALSGERTMALSQYDTLSAILMDELGVGPAAETDQLYDQILAGEIGAAVGGSAATVTASQSTPLAPPFQALTTPPHFVGRETEIIGLQAGLTGSGAPVYALVGMGGAGKTTLAAQVAHLLRDEFTDGVLWANAATSTPLDILAGWARAYGYDFSGLGDLASRAAAVRGVLADKSVLIVLDNVLEASAIQPLLPGGAHNPVLLTTRDLDVAHALNAQALLLGELSAASSRQLLAQILGEARVHAEEEAAAQIGALLHYLPLAVEIVAQRLKSRPRQLLAQMAARLGDEAQRLGLEISDRAVRASFVVSWDALDEGLQRLFALQAVFAGRPFAAEAIAYLAERDLFDVEDQLYALVALSLLREEGERSFRQHPLLADFAQEQLAQADWASVDEVYGRMVEYYLAFAQENREAYDLLEPEWGNLMAATETAHRLAQWDQVLAFTNALQQTWLTRARYGEARRAYALAQEAVEKVPNDRKKAINFLRWGEVCIEQTDYAEARQLLMESLHLWYQFEEGAEIADARYHLSRIDIEQNRYAEAERALAECEAIRRELGDEKGLAVTYFGQARLAFDFGPDYDKAETLGRKADAIQEKLGDDAGRVQTTRLLAQVAIEKDELKKAESLAMYAVKLGQEVNDPLETASAYYVLLMIHRMREEWSRAHADADLSLQQFRRSGQRRAEGMVLHQLSLIHKDTQQVQKALELEQRSLEIFEDLNDQLGAAYAYRTIGDLYQLLAEPQLRDQAWRTALHLAQRLEHEKLHTSLSQRLATAAVP